MSYLIFMLPGLLLGLIAAAVVKSTFVKYSHVAASSGMTGAEAARHMLDSNGLRDVRIEMTQGFLSDHFDPSANVLRLSPDVYQSDSLSSIGVACHEAGHALQKATGYAPLAFRTALVPVAKLGSNLWIILFMIGMAINSLMLVKTGIVLFSAAVFFTIVTLPVEWDASARAKKLMVSSGIVTPSELPHAASVLNAAFMTYVASAVTAVLQLLYYLLRSGLLGGRR
jgi:hypothetical protein